MSTGVPQGDRPDRKVYELTTGGRERVEEWLQRRVALERLGVDPAVAPGGHLAALSHPHGLATVIAGYLESP